MKEKLKIFVIFILMLFMPMSVFADTDVEFSCFDKVMLGNSLKCKISLLNSAQTIKGIQMNYGYDKAFSYVKTTVGSDWTSASVNNEGLAIFNINGIKKDSSIAEVNFLVSNDAVVGKEYDLVLSNILLSDGDKDISIANKSSKVKILSVKDVLKSLSVNDKDLELKDGVTEYEIPVLNDVNEVTIGAVLADDNYHFIDGFEPSAIKNLNVGDNHIKLKIGTKERELITFNINVNRLKANETAPDNNDVVNNPKTGVNSLFVVIILLGLSIGLILFYKNEKKKGV